MTVQTLSDAEFLRRLKRMEFCRYDPVEKLVHVSEEVCSENFYYGLIYRKLVKFLTIYRPEGELFNYPKASDVVLSYYSGCLLRYIFDVLDAGVDHKDTCWYKNCENSRLIGYTGETIPLGIRGTLARSTLKDADKLLKNFDSLTPSAFHVEGGWLKYRDPYINQKILSFSEKIRLAIRVLFRGPHDRSLSIISRIREDGFNETAAYQIKQGVFGYSQKSASYSVFHGKHRVVAIMYLVEKGFLPPHTTINFPTVSYPFRHFGNSAGKECLKCGLLANNV